MTWSRLLARFSWVPLLAVLACGTEDDLFLGDEALAASSALRGGTVTGGHGAVELVITGATASEACTATIIHPRGLITAAHCFDNALGTSENALVPVRVNYTEDGTNFRCLLDGRNGRCANAVNGYVRRQGTFSSGVENDFAVLTVGSPWTDFDDFRTVTTATPPMWGSVAVWGVGYNHDNGSWDRKMRRASFMVAKVGTSFVELRATDSAGTCGGDSGGPVFYRQSSNDAVQAIIRGDNGAGLCSDSDSIIVGSRITKAKIDFINASLPFGTPKCVEISGWRNHYRCSG